MKKIFLLILTLCLAAPLLQAQTSGKIKNIEGKPTYAETVAYIKSYFDDRAFRNGNDLVQIVYRYDDMFSKIYFKIIDIKFSDCILIIKYQSIEKTYTKGIGLKEHDPETVERSIDLSQVESFTLFRKGDPTFNETFIYGLGFDIKGGVMSDKMDLPFAQLFVTDAKHDSNFDTLKDSKIYKAFNHLRKLCGAPDPIEF